MRNQKALVTSQTVTIVLITRRATRRREPEIEGSGGRSLREMLQATSHETGSFHGRKRPQAKWLKKDQEMMAEVDELAMEIC